MTCGAPLPACSTDDVVARLVEVTIQLHASAWVFFFVALLLIVDLTFIAAIFWIRK